MSTFAVLGQEIEQLKSQGQYGSAARLLIAAQGDPALAAEQHKVLAELIQVQDMQTGAKVLNAIAQTTQMLAHDVRKPFSMLEGILDMLGSGAGPSAGEVAQRFLPEVRRAINIVNGLITDIMLVGTKVNLTLEHVNPEAVIQSTVDAVLRLYPQADVVVAYDLAHEHKVAVDQGKLQRVFANIAVNAIQAIPHAGTITFTTRTVTVGDRAMVSFRIHNTGPHIPSEDLPQVFDAFFTKGKTGGAGLGLTISRQIVMAHGGTIVCESMEGLGTAFTLTLPAANEKSDFTGVLSDSSAAVTRAFERNALLILEAEARRSSESALEAELVAVTTALGRPISLMVVDDEEVYRRILREQFGGTIADALHFIDCKGGEEALQRAAIASPDVVIMDVDMGAGNLNGFETASRLRRRGSNAMICIHSNRDMRDHLRDATRAGANLFLAKPMPRSQFLRVLVEVGHELRTHRLTKC